MPAPAYLISKVSDPLFAVFIGIGAAVTRINREEKEQGRTTKQTVDSGLRRIGFPRADDPLATKN
ncbi:non-classical export 1 protein [Rutstroemia sp. NJR-2017a WRK4]|nr:non-classical export 1 protein [Rutstroemia sp. NJR-2017a WRK4]